MPSNHPRSSGTVPSFMGYPAFPGGLPHITGTLVDFQVHTCPFGVLYTLSTQGVFRNSFEKCTDLSKYKRYKLLL